jgi:glycerophosphoryl diester phosphodiesterase
MIAELLIFLLILYLYASAPRINGLVHMSQFLQRSYAHRGLKDNSSDHPENSLRAFLLAVENGYGIELDVQLTKDGIPVVFHDRALERACGTAVPVKDMTLHQLKGLMLFNSDESIPTLKEALEVINGRVPLIIELKVHQGDDLSVCEKAQEILDDYKGLYCVESFHPFAMVWYRKKRPHILRGQLSLDYMKERSHGLVMDFLLHNLLFNFMAKPSFIAYRHQDKKGISIWLSKSLFRCCMVAYTVMTPEEYYKNSSFFHIQIFEGFFP